MSADRPNGNARRAPGAFHESETSNNRVKHTATGALPQSAGAIGMRHYAMLLGDDARPLYLLVDKRADGSRRIVA